MTNTNSSDIESAAKFLLAAINGAHPYAKGHVRVWFKQPIEQLEAAIEQSRSQGAGEGVEPQLWAVIDKTTREILRDERAYPVVFSDERSARIKAQYIPNTIAWPLWLEGTSPREISEFPANQAAALDAPLDVVRLVEEKAQAIYEQWSDDFQYVPWVPGGNSLKQDEARRLARDAIAAKPGEPS